MSRYPIADDQIRAMSEPIALLPCPFCGGEGENLSIGYTGTCWVRCCVADCGCEGLVCDGESDAINAWNTRAAPASEPVAWEELVEDCAKIAEGHVGMYAGTDASEDTVKAYDEACRDVAEAIRNEHGVDVDAATGTADDQDFR